MIVCSINYMTLSVSTHTRKHSIYYGGMHITHTHTHMGLCIHVIYNGGTHTNTHTWANTCTCTSHTHTGASTCIDGIMHAQDATCPGMCSHSR